MNKAISVNVGLPKELAAIIKTPVSGPVRVRTLNLDGDGQADLTVHGGVDKAIYLYPSEHYEFWHQELGEKLLWAAFGENLTMQPFGLYPTGSNRFIPVCRAQELIANALLQQPYRPAGY